MAVHLSLRNMPDYLWSQADGTSDKTKQNRTPTSNYDMLQFPKTKAILWDSSPIGHSICLNVASYRKPQVYLCEKLLRLLQRQCENHPQQTLSTILLGSLVVDDGGEGVTFHIDRLDTRSNADNSFNLALEDVSVPFQVYINSAKERQSNVEEFTETLKCLQERCCSKASIELAGFLLTRGWCNFYTGGENCVAHVDFNLVTPASEFNAIPIAPVPIVPTALSKNLAGPLSFSHVQGVPKTGYLTMDHTRKLLLVLESDPKALSLPVVGIWISGTPVVHHPFVWSACLRYIQNRHLQDRVCGPPDNFLMVLYSPLHSKPEFYECGTRNGTSGLDFDLFSGYEAANVKRNVKNTNCGVISVDLNCVKVGPKREVFDAALNVFNRKSSVGNGIKSTVKGSGPEDMEPRLTPAPLVAMAPMIQNLVPDVSFVISDPPPAAPNARQERPSPSYINNTNNMYVPSIEHQSRCGNQPTKLHQNSTVPRVPESSFPINNYNEHRNTSSNHHVMPSKTNAYQQSPPQFQPMTSCNRFQPPFVSTQGISSSSVQPVVCQNRNIVTSFSYDANNRLNNGSTIPFTQTFQPYPSIPQAVPSNHQIYTQQYANSNTSYPNRRSETSAMHPYNNSYASAVRPPQPQYNTVPNPRPQDSHHVPEGCKQFTPAVMCNNGLPVYVKPNSAFHLVQNRVQNPINEHCNQPRQTVQHMTQSFATRKPASEVSDQPRHYLPQLPQNGAQADSTCSGKSSDDSGLSVTPDRSNPSPKAGSPAENSLTYPKPFSLDSLSKEQCSPEVYSLLMQQNAQLQQLQSQIQLLLQKQDSTTSSNNSRDIINNSLPRDDSNSSSNAKTDDVPILDSTLNTKQSMTLSTADGFNQMPYCSRVVKPHDDSSIKYDESRSIRDENIREGSDVGSAGLTPLEIRHKGFLPLNSTREDVDKTHEDLLTVMNNIGLHEVVSRSESDNHLESSSSSPRLNIQSENSITTPSSVYHASMDSSSFPMSRMTESFTAEGSSENPQYYENLIANIRQFLDSHEENASGDVSSQDETPLSDQLLNTSSLQSFLKCTKNGQSVDTTLIPKINYMSMMFDSDSDTSVEINAMAMKYLKDEQLTQMMKLQHNALAHEKKGQRKTLLQQLLHSDHSDTPDISQNGFSVNDMTFATRNYMEKHGLLEKSSNASDKSLDFDYQMKTDYSLSSNEVSSPVRHSTRHQLRLLTSPVKKEILDMDKTDSMSKFSSENTHSYNHYQRSAYSDGSDQFLSDSPVFNRANSGQPLLQNSFMENSHNPHYKNRPLISDDDDDKILDIVKLKQMPKLL